MRLWSIHPKYLDTKRLTAQWREALLCRNVLEGKTKGYKHHPQFLRAKDFNEINHNWINEYLLSIWNEANRRGYNFDRSKINLPDVYTSVLMEVSEGQIEYEFHHMEAKLNEFDEQYGLNQQYFNEDGYIMPNECFIIVPGSIMKYEKPKDDTLKRFYNGQIMLKKQY